MKPQSPEPKSRKPVVSPSRRLAFEVLNRVASEAAFASVLMASSSGLSREDHGLAQEITLGVLRHQKSLDYFIEKYTRRKIEKLDLPVLTALRMGLYQLRHLARIPPSAAVNESVNLTKLARKTSAASMVNAVLRNAAKHLNDKAGDRIRDPLERLSIEVSHPVWMLARWIEAFGEEEARELAAANNRTPRSALRINTLRSNPDPASVEDVISYLAKSAIEARPSPLVRGAFTVEHGSAAPLSRLAEEGLIYLQDEASQLVSLLLDAMPNHRVLDLCAAPGSKTSHIAALTEDRAPIIAGDLHPHRLATLLMTCKRLGISSIDALALDATRELPFVAGAGAFDRVPVYAPCTGTGTLRRNPEIKWRLTATDIQRLSEIQLALLGQAASVVAKDGRLVYSTCSLEPEENEGVIKRFLETHTDFQLIYPKAPEDCTTAAGFVRTFPHRHNTDGFFAAVLERKAD